MRQPMPHGPVLLGSVIDIYEQVFRPRAGFFAQKLDKVAEQGLPGVCLLNTVIQKLAKSALRSTAKVLP